MASYTINTLKPFSSGVKLRKYTTTTPKLFSLRKRMTPKKMLLFFYEEDSNDKHNYWFCFRS